jgi:hypothetical protein
MLLSQLSGADMSFETLAVSLKHHAAREAAKLAGY